MRSVRVTTLHLSVKTWLGLAVIGLLWATAPSKAQSPTSTPPVQIAVSQNTSGSLGNLCSSQSGLAQLIQQGSDGRALANFGFNFTLPADLNNAAALGEIAEVRDARESLQVTDSDSFL